MPTDEENVQYLYLVLTSSGPSTIDFSAVGSTLSLKPGATSKRWSRLKKAMNEGKSPGPTAYEFLWLCVKHSNRDKALDWNDIASKCNTTAGAASKRYSRMKQAFESGATAPPASKGKTDTPSTPAKATGTSKRKRSTASKKEPEVEDDVEGDDDEGAEKKKPAKRARATNPRPRTAAKSKKEVKKEEAEDDAATVLTTEATTLIKPEPDVEGDDVEEYVQGDLDVVEEEGEEETNDRVASWLQEMEV